MDMLTAVSRRASGSTPEELRPTAECKKFHCAVMYNAIGETDMNSPNETCPNKYKTKFPSQVAPPKESVMTACPCKNELAGTLKFSTANKMIGICSEWSGVKKTTMLNFVINTIIRGKDSCFQPNIVAYQQANAAAIKAILNSPQGGNCLTLLSTSKGAAQTVTQWYGKTHTMIASGGQTFMRYDAGKYKLPAQCGPMLCTIFKTSLADTKRCFWNNNTNLNMTGTDDITKISTMCAKALMTVDVDDVTANLCKRRKVEGPYKKLTCPPQYWVWNTTTTTTASARLLLEDQQPEVQAAVSDVTESLEEDPFYPRPANFSYLEEER